MFIFCRLTNGQPWTWRMSGCKHKGARKVQKSYQCIHSTERESTPSKFLLHIVNVSVIYLYLYYVLNICFVLCELDCRVVLTMLTQSEQKIQWRHIESVHRCSHWSSWNSYINIMLYMYRFTSLSASFCSQWLSSSACSIVWLL